ncbi:hypothetical protein E4U59_006538 [Claviceps monticola]|nr:hypothetical protein E4U59_006538 [Claviceps monticola]
MASLVSTNPSIAEAFVRHGHEPLGEDLCNKYFSSLLSPVIPFSRSISRLASGQRRSYHIRYGRGVNSNVQKNFGFPGVDIPIPETFVHQGGKQLIDDHRNKLLWPELLAALVDDNCV